MLLKYFLTSYFAFLLLCVCTAFTFIRTIKISKNHELNKEK